MIVVRASDIATSHYLEYCFRGGKQSGSDTAKLHVEAVDVWARITGLGDHVTAFTTGSC
jgi:hypothetical protein